MAQIPCDEIPMMGGLDTDQKLIRIGKDLVKINAPVVGGLSNTLGKVRHILGTNERVPHSAKGNDCGGAIVTRFHKLDFAGRESVGKGRACQENEREPEKVSNEEG